MAYEEFCAACTYLSERANYSGKYWCERKGIDIEASAPKCYNFCEAYSRSNYARENMYQNSQGSSSSGCYLTTIMCKILNYPNDNYYLNTLRKFRDNVMLKDKKYLSFLLMYDFAGPMISYELEKDKNKEEIAKTFFNNYITKSVTAIELEKYDTAINIYKAMTEELGNRYHIDINLVTPEKVEDVDITTLGHGKRKIKAL